MRLKELSEVREPIDAGSRMVCVADKERRTVTIYVRPLFGNGTTEYGEALTASVEREQLVTIFQKGLDVVLGLKESATSRETWCRLRAAP